MAIAFKLALGKELVRRGLVRERGMRDRILQHIRRLLPVHARLDVDELSWRGGSCTVDALIVDVRDGAAKIGLLRSLLHLELVSTKNDGDSEVDLDFADGVAEVFELTLGVGAGIDDDDAVCAAKDHLVDAEVFKVATVREVDIGRG